MINGGLAFIVFVLGSAAVWLYFVLRKLKHLENKQFLDKVYKNAEKDIHGVTTDELVKDSIDRRANRDADRKPFQ